MLHPFHRRAFLGWSASALASACSGPAAETGPVAAATAASPLPFFDLRRNAWVALHHVLYRQGVKANEPPKPDETDGLEAIDRAHLEPEAAAAWGAAVQVYAGSASKKDPVRDDDLGAVSLALSAHGSDASAPPAALPPDLAGALAQAMPIYRTRFWPAHEAASARFADTIAPLIGAHGAHIASELADAYRTTWLAAPLVVDLSPYANVDGAYTTLGPPHTVFASADPRNQGTEGLEILFHEASHAIVRPVRDALARELEAQNKKSFVLWHTVLFMTTGEVVRRHLPGHTPYAYKEGLWEVAWPSLRGPLEREWLPYVRGEKTFDAAVHDLVAAVP